MSTEKIEFTAQEQEKLNRMFEQWMYDDQNRKWKNFKELNESAKTGGIVFAGDSITEAYPIHELLPTGLLMYNRGISGITSGQLLENIDIHILSLAPKKLFLLIGTNDIERDVKPQQIASNIQEICNQTLANYPSCEIVVISVYPVNETKPFKDLIGKRTNLIIQEINQEITKRLTASVSFLNLYPELSKDGNLNPDYTFDGLHLSIKGFQKVSQLLLPYME